MDVHVTFIDPNEKLHGITVRDAQSEETAEQAANELMKKICQEQGWDFSEFEISVVEIEIPTEKFDTYLMNNAVDPRD